MGSQKAKGIAAVAMIVGLAIAAHWARASYDIEWTPAALRDLVDGAGIWGPILFVVLISLRPILVIPSQIFFIAAGLCFGTVQGALYAATGVTLGGLFAFGLTRWVGRDAFLDRVPSGLRTTLEGGGQTATFAILFLGAAYPIGPILWIAIAAALTGLALPAFVVALFGGSFVRAATYAYFGNSLVDAQFHEMILGGMAIGAVAMLPLLHPRIRAYVWRLLREE